MLCIFSVVFNWVSIGSCGQLIWKLVLIWSAFFGLRIHHLLMAELDIPYLQSLTLCDGFAASRGNPTRHWVPRWSLLWRDGSRFLGCTEVATGIRYKRCMYWCNLHHIHIVVPFKCLLKKILSDFLACLCSIVHGDIECPLWLQVLVMTAQILLNILRHSIVKMEAIHLLILDECHHAVKKHPYSLVMSEFYHITPKDKRPCVFGMTASPVNLKGMLFLSLYVWESLYIISLFGHVVNIGYCPAHVWLLFLCLYLQTCWRL